MRLCSHCPQSLTGGHSKTLCDACYQYQQLRGISRPRYLWAEKCKNCSKPRRDDRRDGFVKGRCNGCYNYFFRYKKDRTPAQIAALAPHGWCECGKPAAAVVRLRWGKRGDNSGYADYPLCVDCRKEEQNEV